MGNNLKTSDSNYERNAFRRIRKEQAEKEHNNYQANVLKNNMNTYSKAKSHEDFYID